MPTECPVSWNAALTIFSALAGVALCVLWWLILIAERAWNKVWSWIDDAKRKPSYLINRWCELNGYKKDNYSSYNPWRNDKGSSAGNDYGVFGPVPYLLFAPIVLALALWFYPVAIAAFTLYLLARLARFSRRLSKRFELHEKDPEAHK